MGFILAASGSAIGLGNIVFFGANAYKFGGGAFYIPYLIALFVIGIPVMMLEFGIGHQFQASFPLTLGKMTGRVGEFVGWWALLNASIITMYYITMLAWVLGMLIGSFGPLWQANQLMSQYAAETLPNPVGYFFHSLASPIVLLFVALVWIANIVITSKGTKTIEATVKVFVPAMWVAIVVLIVRGLTLPGGWDGVLFLFTPDFGVMGGLEVWRGAFGQIFFSLSLGFGLLTAYASYLPRKANTNNYAIQTALMNSSFEYIAGFAIFSMLFAFAVVPKASTLAMSFFVLPAGIAKLPTGVGTFGVLFFTLLLFAGLSSSVSLIEGTVSAVIDKFHIPRAKILIFVFVAGFLGSLAFAWPKVIDAGLAGDGTLGLTLLDMFDHKAFGYGLMIVGLLECVLVGWVYGIDRFLLERKGEDAKHLSSRVYALMIRYLIPLVLLLLLGSAFYDELHDGLYGASLVDPKAIGGDGGWTWLAPAVPAIWIAFTTLGAALLTLAKGKEAKS